MLFMSANVYAGTVVVELTVAECELIAAAQGDGKLAKGFEACAHVAKLGRSDDLPSSAKSE